MTDPTHKSRRVAPESGPNAMSHSLAGRRVLMVLSLVDLESTQSRVMFLGLALARAGARVDFMTHNEDVVKMANERMVGAENIRIIHNPPKPVFWTPPQRDDIVRGFLKQNIDLKIPGSDMPYWKASAFDDFRGHVSSHTYDRLDRDYAAIIVPIPSVDEAPSLESDVLMSNCLFHAREYGIPSIGLQINPARLAPHIYRCLLDHIVVRGETERRVHVDAGFPAERVSIMDEPKHGYCIETVEDVYRNLMFDERVNVPSRDLVVLIINHSKYRSPIIEAINTVRKLPFDSTVCFIKVSYEVRDLHEDQIVDEFIRPQLERLGRQYYVADIGAMSRLLMIADVTIATTYVTPISFVSKYGKGAVVYNPMRTFSGSEEGVEFITRGEHLRDYLCRVYERKRARLDFVQIVAGATS